MAEAEIESVAQLNEFVARHKVVVVDFYVTWCEPCLKIMPFVNKKAKEHGVAVAKINVDIAEDITEVHVIQAMPTFKVLVWNNGKAEIAMTKTGGTEAVVTEVFQHAKTKK